jgi:AcrR family transcriptional regulator
MDIPEPTGGLRDRKRRETRDRIEQAAVSLVLRDGLEHATIDAISELADISPRTFFNYFDSKEDAILGLRDIDLTEETIAAHLAEHAGADTIDSIVGLLFGVLDPSLINATTHTSRLEVARRHPELMARQMAKFMQRVEQLTTAVGAVLGQDPAFAGQSPDELAASADIVMAICTGGTRLAMKEWVASGNDATAEELKNRAISLIREVVERLK